jgi:hypothetical protein
LCERYPRDDMYTIVLSTHKRTPLVLFCGKYRYNNVVMHALFPRKLDQSFIFFSLSQLTYVESFSCRSGCVDFVCFEKHFHRCLGFFELKKKSPTYSAYKMEHTYIHCATQMICKWICNGTLCAYHAFWTLFCLDLHELVCSTLVHKRQ